MVEGSGGDSGGERWVSAAEMASKMILPSRGVGLVVVAARGVGYRRRWRRERGGSVNT
jgi:hypothetical protein